MTIDYTFAIFVRTYGPFREKFLKKGGVPAQKMNESSVGEERREQELCTTTFSD
jgi:hypothetical protein